MLRFLGLPEAIGLCALALGLGLPTLLGFPPSAGSLRQTLMTFLNLLPFVLLIGLGSQFASRLGNREALREYRQLLSQKRWWTEWLRLWIACVATSYGYFWLKLCVPLLRPGTSYDAALWRADRILHGGFSPTLLIANWLPASDTLRLPLRFLDTYYGLWLMTVVVALAWMTTGSDERLRRAFVSSCLLLWGMGAATYLAVPAVGPAYAYPAIARDLNQGMPISQGSQGLLGENHVQVQKTGRTGLAQVDATRGVAALPSLHVAFHVLFFAWAWRRGSRWRWLFGTMALLTFIGSVRSGWHYAVDGYLGALLALGALWLTVRVADQFATGVSSPE